MVDNPNAPKSSDLPGEVSDLDRRVRALEGSAITPDELAAIDGRLKPLETRLLPITTDMTDLDARLKAVENRPVTDTNDLATRVGRLENAASLTTQADPTAGPVKVLGIKNVGGFVQHIFETYFGAEAAAFQSTEMQEAARDQPKPFTTSGPVVG